MNQNFVQRLRVNHFRYRQTVFHPREKGMAKKIGELLFPISSRGQLRSRTKSKIIGFTKTARFNSIKNFKIGSENLQIFLNRAVFEKPIIFDFVRFLSRPRDEIEKSGSPLSSLFLSLLDGKNRLAISEMVSAQSLHKVWVNLKKSYLSSFHHIKFVGKGLEIRRKICQDRIRSTLRCT